MHVPNFLVFHKKRKKINNMPWQLFISFSKWLTDKEESWEKNIYFPVSKCVETGRHQTGSDALVSPKKNILRKFEWTSGLIYFAVHYQQKNVVKFGLNEHKNRNLIIFTPLEFALRGHSLTTLTRGGG